jgi:putative ABC transport system substrate-binding protein
MNRRDTVLALLSLGAGTFAVPFAVFSQQVKKMVVVGVLRSSDQVSSQARIDAFKQGLQELGYIEGKNLTLHLRFSDGNAERLAALAAELVQLKVDIIMAADTVATRAAQRATKVIPIVIGTSTDPVASGLVASLARPGGNTTGLSNMASDTGPKRLQLLVALVPKMSRVAILLNPSNPASRAELENIEEANKHFGLKLLVLEVKTPGQIGQAFATMVKQRAEGVVITSESLFSQQRVQIAELALKYRLPSIAFRAEFAEAGVLMNYGPNANASYRHAAIYVDKILKGAKPGDLPIEQATKFDLVINRKTAKALGITIPQSLLMNADRVIE